MKHKDVIRYFFLVAIFAIILFGFGCDENDDEDKNDANNDDKADDDSTDDDSTDDDTTDDDSSDDDDDDDDDNDDDDETPSTVDCEPYGYDATPTIVNGPYLQHVTRKTMRILWQTDEPANTVVRFGETDALEYFQCDLKPKTYHEIEVDKLSAETMYHYVVRSDGAQSVSNTFITAPLYDSPFTFTVYGDSRSRPEYHQEVVDGMINAAPDFVFNVGDVVGDGWVFEQYEDHHFGPARELMANTPMYVSIGNHEGEAIFFYNLFSFPDPEKYYTFDYGNARFISLNTNRLYLWGFPQYEWLESELQRAQDDGVEWIFTFAHHPAWSEGWDSPGYVGEILMRPTVIPLMEQYGVDVFFCGHTHDYERGLKNDVYHIITGGGGASLDSFQQDFEHITVYESRLHYVNVEIADKTAVFSATDPDGTVFDTWEIQH